jgi:hypothetical protein
MDFVTELPPSTTIGYIYDSIFIVIDRYSKMAYYVLYRSDIKAEGLVEVFLREIFRLYRLPKSIVSDRGSLFTSKFWSTFCYYLGVRRGLSTAFYP